MILEMKVSHAYKDLPIEEKVSFYQNVHDQMSAVGSDYPSPTTTYLAGNAQIDLFRKAQVIAKKHAKGSSAAMHDEIKKTEVIIDDWAKYVDKIANGNKAMIEAAGFDATAGESVSTKVTAQPVVTSVNPDIDGVMGFLFGLLPGDAITFNLIVATDLSGISQMGNMIVKLPVAGVTYFEASTMQRKITLNGLPKLVQLHALCYTTNRAGNSTLSKIIKFSC